MFLILSGYLFNVSIRVPFSFLLRWWISFFVNITGREIVLFGPANFFIFRRKIFVETRDRDR